MTGAMIFRTRPRGVDGDDSEKARDTVLPIPGRDRLCDDRADFLGHGLLLAIS